MQHIAYLEHTQYLCPTLSNGHKLWDSNAKVSHFHYLKQTQKSVPPLVIVKKYANQDPRVWVDEVEI